MKKPKFSIIYGIILICFTVYMVLDTFVLSSAYSSATEMNLEMFESENTSEDSDNTDDLDSNSNSTSDSDSESSNTGSESDSDSSSSESSDTHRGKHSKKSSNSSSTSSGNDSSDSSSDSSDSSSQLSSSVVSSDTVLGTYESDEATITLSQYTYEDTEVYVADVTLSSAQYLKTAFAEDTYGKNVTETTSEMAEANDAILAINGDNYGSQESGYVIRNGVIYRDDAGDNDILCIFTDGSMKIYSPSEYSAEELLEMGVWQAFSFGPALVENGKVSVSEDEEVGKAMASNPRTAIGMIDELHYLIVVSDGRTSESEGLSLSQLAEFMESLGATTAYNLDGGGSSTMVFQGEVVNNPTTTGNSIKEREVNDIVYIG